MLHCPVCEGDLHVREMACPDCEVAFQGDFHFPRLLRLSAANLALAEALVLAGGNLKVLAQSLEISYPTLRKRIDELISELQVLRAEDEKRIDGILRDIETGRISAARGTRLIRELNAGDPGPSGGSGK